MGRKQVKVPRVSRAEWEVMKAIWSGHPVAANEVAERLAPRHDWSPRTVKTMLNRLVRKGALGFQVQGKRYLYSPRVSQEVCVRSESESFLARVFNGQEAAILLHYARHATLTPDDIAELKRVLEQKQEH